MQRTLAVALSLAFLVACGGDTTAKNEYVAAVNRAQTEFAAGIAKARPGADAAKTFDDMQAAIDKVVADLRAVDPPDEVAALHERLVREMAGFGTAVEQAAGSLTSGDPGKLAAAQAAFTRSTAGAGRKIDATIGQINAKLQE